MKITLDDFLTVMQKFIAIESIASSALRGQKSGPIGKARDVCALIDLAKLSSLGEEEFKAELDDTTKALLRKLQLTPKSWGVARKAINLFLRHSLYNRYLSKAYHLEKIEPFLESPMDGVVGNILREECNELPAWPGLKHLSQADHEKYQLYIKAVANESRMSPVHLDIYLWTQGRKVMKGLSKK